MRRRADRLERVLAWLKAGARDERGVSAVIFALSLAVLAPMALGVFDIYLATEQKGKLQDAMDAATLYAARSNAQTDQAIDAIGDKALAANLSLIEGAELKTSDFRLSGTKVVSTASVQMAAFAPGLFDHPPVSVTSEVQRAIDKLEIALVLDNTGSMVLNNSPKLATLKTEAKKLVDKLAAAAALSADPTPIRIALVPFSNTVRVQGATSLTAYNTTSHTGAGIPSWIDPQGKAHNGSGAGHETFDVANTDRLSMMKAVGQSWNGCVEARRQPYDVQENAPVPGTPATMYTPYFWPDEPDNGSSQSTLNSYKTDGGASSLSWAQRQARTAKYAGGNITGGTFSFLSMTYTKGPNAGCTLQPIIPLTTNTATIKAGIDNMTAIGETNIPLGMMWGWNAVGPTTLLSAQGSAYGTPHLKKIVILMTDGENTLYDSNNTNDSYYGGLGYVWQGMLSGITGSSSTTQRTTAMNNRLTQLCTNMKARKIEIYTVRVEVTSGSSTLLQGCASAPDKFFDVANVNQLGSAFDAIAAAITNLRITK
jgi:Flp pilus assembly protein TadG